MPWPYLIKLSNYILDRVIYLKAPTYSKHPGKGIRWVVLCRVYGYAYVTIASTRGNSSSCKVKYHLFAATKKRNNLIPPRSILSKIYSYYHKHKTSSIWKLLYYLNGIVETTMSTARLKKDELYFS